MSCWDGLSDWLTHWDSGAGWSIPADYKYVLKITSRVQWFIYAIKAKVNWENCFTTCHSLTEEGKNVNTL